MNYLISFFSLSHLFFLRPQPMVWRGLAGLIVAGILLLGLGAISSFVIPKTKDGLKVKGLRRIVHLGLTMGILVLTYAFFAWQSVAFLSARFWILILAVVTLVWGAFILRYFKIEVPKLRSKIEDKRKFEKYIP